MPVQSIAKAFLVDKGFSGWVSLETFDRRMREERMTQSEMQVEEQRRGGILGKS